MVDCRRFENKKICVAVSGGADSVALLHYLKAREKEGGYYLSAIHCEHGIRGEESLRDMRFVRELCADWGIPLHIVKEDCPARAAKEKVSLETAARNFRYERFFALLQKEEADYIATAHHQEDGAETVLFRLARGSALFGAAGIREDGKMLRPFLRWSKEEILEYIQANGLSFQEDSTNFEKEATRNKIRLEILPKLEEAVPGAKENLLRFARLAGEDDALLYRLAAPLLTQEKGEPTVKFSVEKPLFTRACLLAMKGTGLNKDYTETHLTALFELQNLECGAVVTLPHGLRAKRGREGILFYWEKVEEKLPLKGEAPFSLAGYDGGRYEVKLGCAPIEGDSEYALLFADREKIPLSARFRFRKEGDYIYPFGGGKKSLKKFLNEKKIPVEDREGLPLIAEESGEVYAVCGVEISRKIAVDGQTKEKIYIAIRRRMDNGEAPQR